MAMFARGFCCSCSILWTWEENKRFELYLAKFPDDTPDRWHTMASFMQGRTPLELKLWYEKLLLDVAQIESGRVEPPWPQPEGHEEEDVLVEEAAPTSSTGSRSEPDRKKGVPWTEEEHSDLEDADAGGWPCSEVLHSPGYIKEGMKAREHSRHYNSDRANRLSVNTRRVQAQ